MPKYEKWTHKQYESFVKRWQSAYSVQEVVEKTGLSYQRVTTRSGFLRRKGVPLKTMRNINLVDYDKLKILAKNTHNSS